MGDATLGFGSLAQRMLTLFTRQAANKKFIADEQTCHNNSAWGIANTDEVNIR
ncbi:MAG: hypothetical protein WC799_07265 [Desulfobacteraceae bacterium]|jgi:hypothetical protein